MQEQAKTGAHRTISRFDAHLGRFEEPTGEILFMMGVVSMP